MVFYWSLPVRTHYNVLKNNQPTSWDNWVRTELPMERDEARDKLDIIWMADDFVMQVLIDRSGSMLGQPMENAKQGAKSLVDVVLEGLTAIGVVSFSDYATQDQPITRIPDPGAAVKTEIKEVIDGFTADGATAMYDAALGALFNLNVYCNTHKCKGPKVVFLLSDGMDTASSYTDGVVISEYQEARVPLFTLGYSEDSPGETLSTLAENTGGRFYYSPTTMDSIQAVFLAANCAVGALTGMASGSSTAPAGQNANFSCYVDPTIGSLSAVAGFTGEEGDVTFTWRGPKGLLSETVTCNPAGTNVSCFGSIPPGVIQSQGLGSYELLAANHTGNDIKVTPIWWGLPWKIRGHTISPCLSWAAPRFTPLHRGDPGRRQPGTAHYRGRTDGRHHRPGRGPSQPCPCMITAKTATPLPRTVYIPASGLVMGMRATTAWKFR